MATKIFIAWIAIQLIIMGIIGFNVENNFLRGRLKCPPNNGVSVFKATLDGIIFPLAIFTQPFPKEIQDYCSLQENK